MRELWLAVLAFTVSIILVVFKPRAKKIVEECAVKADTALRLGLWRSLEITFLMLFYGKIPNYEVIHRKMREYYLNLAFADIPTCKEGLLVIANLSVAKQLMSSVRWVNHFRHNYYVYYCTWNKPYGLLLGGGEYWREARALTLKILHKLEFFKQENMESLIGQEVEEIIEKIDGIIKRDGGGEGTFSPHRIFQVNAFNLVSQVCWGERYRESDPLMKTVIREMNRFNRSFNVGFGILELFPWIAKLCPNLTFYGDFKDASDSAVAYFKKLLMERRRSGSYRSSPQDFTDYFLQEIDLQKKPEIINENNFYITMRDLLWAGTDTTNSTLEHALLHLSLRPEVQRRVQAEIDETVGHIGLPCYADRTSMPYTQAVILEIFRFGVPVPMTSRSNTLDCLLGDTEIPKGSLGAISIYSIHRSHEIWEDPDEFRPERFLSTEGEIINAEKIIPFGYGKRLCIGEPLAKTFLFITLVTLLQRYEFQLSKHHPPPNLANIPGLSRCPVPYHLTVKERS